jgi:PhnB protein
MYSEDELPGSEGEKIMHVALTLDNGSVLMGSDTVEAMGSAVFGSNFSPLLLVDSQADADRFYGGLSAVGQATMPLAQAPWGD